MPEKNEGFSATAETLCGKAFQKNLGSKKTTPKAMGFSQHFGNLLKYWEKSLGRQTG
jgi:hypothetical protein